MKSHRRRAITPDNNSNSTQLLALALFLMLLAFFIVLNALSTFDENKVTPIMGSLDYTFSNKIADINEYYPSTRPTTGEGFQGEGEINTLNALRKLFTAHITGIDIKQNESRGIMQITLPYNQLNTAVMAVGQPQQSKNVPNNTFFLPTLVSLLKTGKRSQPYRMDMILELAKEPVKVSLTAPDDLIVQRNKIGKLARRLQQSGVPANQMSIGLQKGQQNQVRLLFRPFQAIEISPPDKAPKNDNIAGGIL